MVDFVASYASVRQSATSHDLSIPELFHELNNNLGLEYTRVRETRLLPVVSTTLETDVGIS